MSFVETRLFDGRILFNTVGGAAFSTDVVRVNSGKDFRNQNWDEALGKWELGDRMVDESELRETIAFFRARKGKAIGFRFKDWGDYNATSAEGFLQGPAGNPIFQLYKRYTDGFGQDDREIKKLVAGKFSLYRNGALQTAGVAPGNYSVDINTGIVTLVPFETRNITGITKAAAGVVSCSAHGWVTGDKIPLSGIVGMTELNGVVATITVINANSFSIDVNTTTFSTYVSGGTAKRFIHIGESFSWAGEFDVPVRFDTDEIRYKFEAMSNDHETRLYYLNSLPVVGVRE